MIVDLRKLEQRINREPYLQNLARAKTVGQVSFGAKEYPIFCYEVGTVDSHSPTLLITGGFHGIERIGSQLAWSLLKTILDRLAWDQSLRELFKTVRLVVLPLVNPVGYARFTRANGQGVDLMRNAPVNAKEPVLPLIGGQRWSPKLPWFRGPSDQLEPENQIVFDVFKREAIQSSCLLALDFHSGFGMRDRIWFPHSYTSEPFEKIAELYSLIYLLEEAHPYHIYQIEPQSKGYLLHGDIWDYLYLQFKEENPKGLFIPLTLEMGSWSWVRKNPLQIFKREGAFNPIKEHRIKRTYRRHQLLFDFLLKALYSSESWSQLTSAQRIKSEKDGLHRWYH